MTPRQRILAAIDFRAPDRVPVRIYPAPGGLYEHGQKLVDLIRACGHDFGDLSGLALPDPPHAGDFDADGTYHAFKTDAWGTEWEYRIFGIWGHPVSWPLSDLRRLDTYRAPVPPPVEGPAFEAAGAAAARHREQYFLLGGGGALFEQMRALRRFEDVLMDLACDTPEIGRLADVIVEHVHGCVRHALALDADAVSFGDDFGTSSSLMISPAIWSRFFRPRYDAVCAPIRAAGKRIFMHSCGQVSALLDEFRDMGVDVIWPQLPLFDLKDLAARCRDLHLAIELHPDRGDLMQRGTPDQIRDSLHRLVDVFDTASGGSWLYLEVDPGFPWENVKALFETVMALRA